VGCETRRELKEICSSVESGVSPGPRDQSPIVHETYFAFCSLPRPLSFVFLSPMKSLRKSLNGNKDPPPLRHQISTPLPAISKPPTSILPPQKVIRALSPYRSQAPQQLSFVKGDFFHVIRDVDNDGSWYEAHNPVSGARGLVPKSMFEEFAKNSAP
jgi:hypothetical protein